MLTPQKPGPKPKKNKTLPVTNRDKYGVPGILELEMVGVIGEKTIPTPSRQKITSS